MTLAIPIILISLPQPVVFHTDNLIRNIFREINHLPSIQHIKHDSVYPTKSVLTFLIPRPKTRHKMSAPPSTLSEIISQLSRCKLCQASLPSAGNYLSYYPLMIAANATRCVGLRSNFSVNARYNYQQSMTRICHQNYAVINPHSSRFNFLWD